MKFLKVFLCFFLITCLVGCTQKETKYVKAYEQLIIDGYEFDYSFVEMEDSKGQSYTLKMLPSDFNLKDSCYIYFNEYDYKTETKIDTVYATVYRAEQNIIYGVNVGEDKKTLTSGTCFVDYDTMEVMKGREAACEKSDMEAMNKQKEVLVEFLAQYNLSFDDIPLFYKWYASVYKEQATAE